MPTKTVFIDSDKASIEVRLGYTKSTTTTAPAIIISHPYGPLGGNIYNNVVMALQKSLMNKGFTTASLNFRGCGNSTGKTSWTGLPEQKDYQAVVNYLLTNNDIRQDYPTISHLVICGYSYGSMIAASIRESRVPTSYVLISYPLRVIWALSTTKMFYFKSQANQLLQSSSCPVLLIYGDQDQFTGIRAYRSWLSTITSDKVDNRVIKDSDHFWMDNENQLIDEIHSWLSVTIQQ
ncbi:Alpha/Beta hydrolase protein [Halteromyces radiatus]|uniref:Alpha/Beta hydrolase protein n=1 Tax=Halteromyces radiatus TaxID=101107 RepID=UPI002220C6FE|nr:Alpha/Beta hydrolase protein [Halteromyces radiatus]KAI8098880.1 Alpha/Beta hydrolase protein [Halteromyces radiatus]